MRFMVLCALVGMAGVSWSCTDDPSRYGVASAGQGGVVVRKEPGPPPRVREEVKPSGPTTHEVELQRRIDDMEAKEREMREEIERLKREKAGTK
jgi:hypothetical protein